MNVESARSQMVDQQIRTWAVLDPRVLDVMGEIPRERFVPAAYRRLAFADTAIPLSFGEVMMAPKVEGRLLQALEARPGDAALEIGTGSGFIAACLARMGGSVTSIDIHSEFTESAARALADLGIDNVTVKTGDAARLDVEDTYDVIAVTGSVPLAEPSFERALRIGGRLFVIIGSEPIMDAVIVTRVGAEAWSRESLFETVVPPLQNVARASTFRL